MTTPAHSPDRVSTVRPRGGAHLTATAPINRRSAAAAVLCFIATIVAANAMTARYGLIPVGLGLTATAGTYAAGLTLLARDWVHHVTNRSVVLLCIGEGALISAVLAGPRLAVASTAAFIVGELSDLLIYERVRHRGWMPAALASNAVAAPIDTVLFLGLAGLAVTAAIPGQLWAKAAATVLTVAVVTAIRALLRHRLRPTRP